MEEVLESQVVSSNAVDISPQKDGGVLKEILTEGLGDATPQTGNQVLVHYVGTLLNGEKFDSSRDRSQPFSFSLGKGNVIKAWDIGVATMKKGEKALLTCRPEYAYGAGGSSKIPPNATLVFEVEVLSWVGEDLTVAQDEGILRDIIVKGRGSSTPNDGALVEVHLVGKHEGRVFEERDVSFTVGEGSEAGICEGLERAIERFNKGEKSCIQLKAPYAFKSEGKPEFGIPPNADVVYEVEMKNFEKAKEAWSMDAEGKIDQATFFKGKGTEYFKAGKYPLALKLYMKMMPLLESNTWFEEDLNKVRMELLGVAHLNIAMCHLKLEQHVEARSQCDKALELDPANVKGHFRRGQANLGMGEPEKAQVDFEEVLRLEPGNKAAGNHIVMCRSQLKVQKSKEKMIYANMFEKFAQRDREKEEEWRRNQPDVMKTLGEWGEDERDREMTDFERENPNILMLNNTGEFKNM